MGSGSGGVSSEQAARYEDDLKKKRAEIARLEAELKDTRANLAKLRAISASGPTAAESEEASAARSTEMASAAKRTKEQQVEIDDLKERLKREIAAHEAKKEEIASLRDNLASEMANLQQVSTPFCCSSMLVPLVVLSFSLHDFCLPIH